MLYGFTLETTGSARPGGESERSTPQIQPGDGVMAPSVRFAGPVWPGVGSAPWKAFPFMKQVLIVVMVMAVALAGCGGKGSNKIDKPAEQLAQEGMDAFNRKKYRKALKSFEQLKDWYPFSKYAILAELKAADAHFELGSYAEAIAAYESFASLHPRNEAIPYVIFQIGMCYFNQMEPVDRDQVATQKALETFKRLRAQYPGSPYAQQAADRIRDCQKNLAGQQMYVARFYFKSKQYKAALERFESVLANYPRDLGYAEEAEAYIEKCRENLAESADAPS